MKNTSSNQSLVINWFENWFFSDNYSIRVLRVFTILTVIFGWALIWVAALEPFVNYWVLVFQIFRYSLAPFAAMLGALFLGARFVQDIYELESYGTGFRYLLATLFEGPPYRLLPPSGWFLPSLTIVEGKKVPDDQKENLIDKIGGPGWLVIESGNVVVLERLDRKSLVLGEGLHYISRFEHIKDIISLDDQRWDAAPIRAITRDGFLVTVSGFQFGYRLASEQSENGHTRRSLSDPYPFSIQAADTLAYERSVGVNGEAWEWGKIVQFRLDGMITDYINKSFLDQVAAPLVANNDPRNYINKQITSRATKVMLKNVAGAELLWHKTGNFDLELDDEKSDTDGDKANKADIRRSIKDQRLKSWLAQWTGTAAVIRARGIAEKLSQEESGRAETTAVMLQSIMTALNDTGVSEGSDEEVKKRLDDNMWNIVLARTAQILESLTSFYGERLDMPDINSIKKSEK